VDAEPLSGRGRGDNTCWRRRCWSRGLPRRSRGLPRSRGQPVSSAMAQDGRVESDGIAGIASVV